MVIETDRLIVIGMIELLWALVGLERDGPRPQVRREATSLSMLGTVCIL